MPQLGDCINNLFEPGNIPTTTGAPPVVPVLTTLYPPVLGVPSGVTYGFDFAKWYNSFNLMAV